jgi:hypothetical protein
LGNFRHVVKARDMICPHPSNSREYEEVEALVGGTAIRGSAWLCRSCGEIGFSKSIPDVVSPGSEPPDVRFVRAGLTVSVWRAGRSA